MNTSEMIVGSACLVSYRDKVLRAEFMEEPENDKVKVCLVDYGTFAVVDVTVCRRIYKYFTTIPKRCYPGALILIQPTGNEEKDRIVVQRFCEIVRGKLLWGYVSELDHAVRICAELAE